ncbi:hypothetical protein BC941DRAFT_430791 [Chlamydoabsidia padenii]|nr:hypothetical protein BC941DRAFT_430791 [Chlamydoabsidia padenii]
MVCTTTHLEGWVLMALIYKDIDDFDYKNALVLSERLYAVDKSNQDFRLLYAKCLYLLGDFNGTYAVLKDDNNNNTTSIPCRYLFARSCLELGILADKTEKRLFYWRSGVQALDLALKDYSNGAHNWADDLTCVALRSHMPSQSSIRNLLGELYIKLENIRGAATQLWKCLAHNRFKFTAFTKICDISPDVANLDTAKSPNDIFKDFDLTTTSLELSSESNLPPLPSTNISKHSTLPRHTKHTSITSVRPGSASASASKLASDLVSAYTSSNDSPTDKDPDSSFLLNKTGLSLADQTTSSTITTPDYMPPTLEPQMPRLRSNLAEITLEQLQALVQVSLQTHPEMPIWDGEPDRGDIEKHKDEILQAMMDDIDKQKAEEAMKNKHGLHKKPPTETTNDLTVNSIDSGDELLDGSISLIDIDSIPPPRLAWGSSPSSNQNKTHGDIGSTPGIKTRLRNVKRSGGHLEESLSVKRRSVPFKLMDNILQTPTTSIDTYFVPWMPISDSSSSPTHQSNPLHSNHQSTNISNKPSLGNTTTGTTTSALTTKAAKEAMDQKIIDAMNKVIRTLRILAMGYFYQSSYYCRETALELQKLDRSQYDTAPVLCLMGQAYYDAGDHQLARVFYRRSFAIAPWYCTGVPIYSTCLWYLEKKQELGLLARVMKDNYCHRYEACIAAGNWTKCSNRGNESIRWFQKAVDLDPSRSYGHALLGYEEWEKDNCLGAKQHFSQCIITDKRSYFGWYGAATAYQGMHEFIQAKQLMEEALRLHPRHPVLLGTMAEILFSLKNYDLAYIYIEKSLATRNNISMEELKNKIKQKLDTCSHGDDDDDVGVGGLSL